MSKLLSHCVLGIALCMLPVLSQAQASSEKSAAESAKAEKAAKAKREAEEKFRAGFERLQFIEGSWHAAAKGAGGPKPDGGLPTAVIAPYMGGKYLEMHGTKDNVAFQIVFSYYAPENKYLMSIVDDQSGVLDVYDGNFDGDGTLVFTNRQFYRVSLIPKAKDGFDWVGEYSADRGKNWKPGQTYAFQRKP